MPKAAVVAVAITAITTAIAAIVAWSIYFGK